jgi:hypothetical protein
MRRNQPNQAVMAVQVADREPAAVDIDQQRPTVVGADRDIQTRGDRACLARDR